MVILWAFAFPLILVLMHFSFHYHIDYCMFPPNSNKNSVTTFRDFPFFDERISLVIFSAVIWASSSIFSGRSYYNIAYSGISFICFPCYKPCFSKGFNRRVTPEAVRPILSADRFCAFCFQQKS